MARLRVLSWNIRTFGTHEPHEVDFKKIAEIIVASQADIVCVQELMIGLGVVGNVGAEISQASLDIISNLTMLLHDLDPGGDWWHAVSGVNSGRADHMRDAYAFLFKQKPAASTSAHAEPLDEIDDLSEPIILRQPGQDHFPGRRPGLFTVTVRSGNAVTLVNIISYHAPTPPNKFPGGAGQGINALATLLEVGGGRYVNDKYVPATNPLPQIDTIVLGDFNYSMDVDGADKPYQNLLSNYTACISTLSRVRPTTYSTDSTAGLRLVSAYDNIFVLLKHDSFAPSLTLAGSDVINFIEDAARQLGDAIGFYPPDIGTEAAWYVIYQDLYKRQHATRGLSDHLPVWAEFAVGDGDGTAAHIRPTSGADNNCLLHAIFGTQTDGVYVAADATARRTEFVNTLQGYRTNQAIPANGSLGPLRNALLSSMWNDFELEPDAAQLLAQLLANNDNPFLAPGFDELFGRYIGFIESGRMLYVHEAKAIACLANITVVLHYVDRGTYHTMTLNPNQPNPVDIYHQALHFSRWA